MDSLLQAYGQTKVEAFEEILDLINGRIKDYQEIFAVAKAEAKTERAVTACEILVAEIKVRIEKTKNDFYLREKK